MARVPRCRIALLGLGIIALLGTTTLSAQENGKLTLTVDGETRLLDIVSCTAQLRGAKGLVGEATDDTDTISFVVSERSNRARNRAQTVMFTSTSTSASTSASTSTSSAGYVAPVTGGLGWDAPVAKQAAEESDAGVIVGSTVGGLMIVLIAVAVVVLMKLRAKKISGVAVQPKARGRGRRKKGRKKRVRGKG